MTGPLNARPIPSGDGDDQLDRIQRALAAAVRDALLRHKRDGNPVAVWQDGRVVWIAPEDIPGQP